MNSILTKILLISLVLIISQNAMADSKKTLEVFQEFLKEYKKIDDQEKARARIQPSNATPTTRRSSTTGNTSSLNWPSRGGLEDWGFQRPSGCQSGNAHTFALAKKVNSLSNWGDVNGFIKLESNEFISGSSSQRIRMARGNSQAISSLQDELNKMESYLNELDDEGTSYIQLTSSGYQNGADVIKAIKRFEIVGQNCANMDGNGAANAIACGLQSKAFYYTAFLENFIQVACHLGLNTPTFQVANVNSNPTLASSSSNNSSTLSKPNKQQENPSNSDSNHESTQNPSEQVANYASQNLSAYDKKYEGIGKKHNPDAEASRCLKFIPSKKQIFNECDYKVEALFCAINPDPNSTSHAFEMAPYFNCATNSIGMWTVSAKSALMGRFSAENVAVFACKKPSYPGAKFNRDSKSFSGRCSEY